ncbi:16S rRNA (guanine(527)-N(7))-methyltransferase RsmG [Gordonia araii NBRC 100433]|nr:16S rRNA (guanine(527)-N(7))-methyltransferase RsmG [Gordonia araii NBRC 100433]
MFGDRTPLAVAYRDWLADAAVTRGLIGPRESGRLWERHILNCGVIGELFDRDARVVDIGSGAGLPGIPVAIARPDLRLVLVEPLLRRTTFLSEVVADLGLENVEVARGRAEEKGIVAEYGDADAVTSRAVAPLDRLVRWSAPLIAAGGRLVAMKGSSAQAEIDEHRAACARAGIAELSVTTVGGTVLPEPTTVVVGRKVAKRGDERRRARSSNRRDNTTQSH